jgi:hypothetical protein
MKNSRLGTMLRTAAVSLALASAAASTSLADPPGYLFQDFEPQPAATAAAPTMTTAAPSMTTAEGHATRPATPKIDGAKKSS